MIVLVVIAAIAGCFLFLRKTRPHHATPVRYFEVRRDEGLWVFTVRPTGMAMPAVLLAALPGAVAAVVLTGWWLTIGHDLDRSAGFFFGAWVISTALAWSPMRRRARRLAAGTTFSVGQGGVLLSNGTFLPIFGQYVLTRRNLAPYGQGAYAHRVDIVLDGVSHTLAGGMSDAQSMSLYHEVGRRLRGDR